MSTLYSPELEPYLQIVLSHMQDTLFFGGGGVSSNPHCREYSLCILSLANRPEKNPISNKGKTVF